MLHSLILSEACQLGSHGEPFQGNSARKCQISANDLNIQERNCFPIRLKLLPF